MAFQRRHTTFTAEESKPLAPRGFVLGSTVMLTSVLTTSRYCSTSSRSHRVSMSSAPARSSISGEQAGGRATRPRSPREDEPRPVDRSDRPACGRAGAGPRRAVASTPPVFARSPNRIRASCHRCGARRPFTTSSRVVCDVDATRHPCPPVHRANGIEHLILDEVYSRRYLLRVAVVHSAPTLARPVTGLEAGRDLDEVRVSRYLAPLEGSR